jgi:hypothetical protein
MSSVPVSRFAWTELHAVPSQRTTLPFRPTAQTLFAADPSIEVSPAMPPHTLGKTLRGTGVSLGGASGLHAANTTAAVNDDNALAAILVTHNLQAVARCAGRVTYLEHTVRPGPVDRALEGT